MPSQNLTPSGNQMRTNAGSAGDKVRNILALVTVIGFIVITGLLAIVFPLVGLAPPQDMINYLRDLSSIYSGIVGLIIGYYFGKP